MKNLKRAKFLKVLYEDSVEAQNVDSTTIINHPLLNTDELHVAHDFAETDADVQADPSVRSV